MHEVLGFLFNLPSFGLCSLNFIKGGSTFSKFIEMGESENFCYKRRDKAKWGVCLEMGIAILY